VSNQTSNIAIRIDVDLYKRLKKVARRNNRSAVAELRTILTYYFHITNAKA